MPLLKRKQFPLLDPPPLNRKDKASKNQPVWYLELTNEVFDDYSDYLQRLTLYKHRVWQCESTGRSNLTYSEALESERIEKKKVQNKLPIELQKAILRRVQFQTARLDDVVTDVYNYFVNRYVAGEQIECLWDDGILYNALILEAPSLEDQISDNVKYKVQLLDEDMKGMDDYVSMAPRKDIKRDRLALSKNLLKKFVREATVKDSYVGAPWIVNETFAEKLSLDTKLPKDLEDAKTLAYSKSRKMRSLAAAERRKEMEAAKAIDTKEGTKINNFITAKSRLEEARKAELLLKYPMEDLDLPVYRRNPPVPNSTVFLDMSPGSENESKTVPNPTGDFPLRPQPSQNTVASDCFGPFLMVWSFLNVFSRPLHLSPFSLDDFESALRHTSRVHKCELVYEVIVSLLNCIIRYRQKAAIQQITPPLLTSTVGTSSGYPRTPVFASHYLQSLSSSNGNKEHDNHTPNDSADDDSESDNDKVGQRSKQNGHQKKNGYDLATSSNNKSKQSECYERGCGSSEVIKIGKNWDSKPISMGKQRQGWEDILIGCINDLAIELNDHMEIFDNILCNLVPRLDSTLDEREEAYLRLSLKDKLAVLQLLVHAVNETSDIKDYMEECQEQLTELRKQKIEINREKKRIQTDRNELEKRFEDVSNIDTGTEASISDDSDSESINEENIDQVRKEAAHVSRHESRQALLKRKQQEREEQEAKRRKLYHQQRQEARERSQELKARASARKKLETQELKLQKKLEQLERDMRKYSTLRLKPLGRDKFYNRYYYLDNVGGAHAHGSGKLFVQSPSVADLLMILENRQAEISKQKKETASTTAASASSTSLSCGHGGGLSFMCQLMEHQGLRDKAALLKTDIDRMVGPEHLEWWESFDDPDTLNALLNWLNPKGVRDYLLKRELEKHLPGLLAGMKKHLSERQTPATEVTRRSTRTKTAPQYPVSGSWLSYTNKLAK